VPVTDQKAANPCGPCGSSPPTRWYTL
jgi:hypothetical protein